MIVRKAIAFSNASPAEECKFLKHGLAGTHWFETTTPKPDASRGSYSIALKAKAEMTSEKSG